MLRSRRGFYRRITFAVATVGAALGLVGSSLSGVASARTMDSSAESRLLNHSFTLRYAALGDSVAAGLGLPADPAASEEDLLCGRSTQAYSQKVSDAINEAMESTGLEMSTTNMSCQGATMQHLTQPQTLGSTTMQPQLDAAFAEGSPTLLTLTMGANDIHWAEFIGACFAASNCDTDSNTAAVNAYIAATKSQLSSALREVRNRSNFILPFVVVTGYYQPISAQCANPNLSLDEIAWIQRQTNTFNNALQAATQRHGWFARFAPVDFTGHDICSADSWLQRPGVPGEPAPFHPTARGQQAIADSVLRAIGVQ